MRADEAYESDIPPEAEPRVLLRHADGAPEQVEYWLDGEQVGLRYLRPDGSLEAEWPYRRGVRHGRVYRWDEPGVLLNMEPYVDGLPHGTAYQWTRDGRVIGTYTMHRGTGIDLWWHEDFHGRYVLTEVHPRLNGPLHGCQWWINHDQVTVHEERHWLQGELHGIERVWNHQGKLRRGYPRYWIRGERTDKRRYLRTAAKDPVLPPYLEEDQLPGRTFPPEIARHLGPREPLPAGEAS
ncbi:MAG: toxin-antitoxin system YwqK family antitoxin [Armatimonadota bacterium]